MIAAPEGENNLHLDVLARLSMMLMDPSFKDQLINAKSVDEFLKLIDDKENDKLKAENDKEEDNKANNKGYRVLAVTACPTGIAHTFMAAATIIHSAFFMSSSVKTFLAPPEPLVSTFIEIPISAALFSKLSAAINV